MNHGSRMILRPLYIDKLTPWIDKPVIKVITGVRRSGKSYILKMLKQILQKNKIDQTQIITINYELLQFQRLQSYIALNEYIHKQTRSTEKTTYVIIDEIQNCEGWERVTASLLAEGNYDIYISGSNASMLSGDLATHIAGRYIEIEVYPLNFSEYCMFADKLNWSHTDKEERFRDYIRYGGFPGLANAADQDEAKIQYLSGIRDTVVLRDVIQRHHIRDAAMLEKILLYVLDNIGQIFSAKRVTDFIRHMGLTVSLDSVSSYLTALKDAKIIYSSPRYDIKGKKIMQRMDKYFICDLGLRYADIGYREADIAQLLENVVYMELRSRGYTVYVGKEGTREVDFIAEKGDDRRYYQVSYLIASDDIREREYQALLNIRDSFPKIVLSMDRLQIGPIEGITHQNLLKFLLQ